MDNELINSLFLTHQMWFLTNDPSGCAMLGRTFGGSPLNFHEYRRNLWPFRKMSAYYAGSGHISTCTLPKSSVAIGKS
jgi:hypothetical protein